MLNTKNEQKTLQKADIIALYNNSVKNCEDFKIGLEYERLSLYENTFETANYADISRIIELFAQIKKWNLLKDNDVIIGAKDSNNANFSISLEPGRQFEFSFPPLKFINEIDDLARKNIAIADKIASVFNVLFVPYGVSPVLTHKSIDILKKTRYLIMAEYFKNKGKFAPVMMRETAGVQVNFDYQNERDALLKLRVAALISPFMAGLFANSPIRGGKLTNYKSFRALAWKFTDDSRTGLFYKNLLENADSVGFVDYIDSILSVPMLFIERDGQKIKLDGKINFETFMDKGYEGYMPTLEDYILHSSLTFPDIRLKNCLEIRNHDSQNLPRALSICAFYKGILHSYDALNEVLELLKFSKDEIDMFALESAKNGLNFDINGKSAFSYMKKLCEISSKYLEKNEQKYLEPMFWLIKNKKCPADFVKKSDFML